MAYTNLPGVQLDLNDGNLPLAVEPPDAPAVLVLGTAGDGINYTPLNIRRLASVRSTFGASGTLLRGAYEVKAQRPENVVVMRIGGTAASLTGIGSNLATGGYTVTTELLDDGAGTQYAIYYNSATGHLAVYDVTNAEWVYDNVNDVDTGDVCVSGTVTVGQGDDIGTLSSPVPMASVTSTLPLHTYTAGTDGVNASRMEMYEFLHKAYSMLDFYPIDFVVPMDVYIDDENVADLSAGEIVSKNLSALADYPTAESDQDVLGKVFIQEYNGVDYFWWDTDNDGIAEIFPTVGASGPSADAFGETLEASDFHEVNFAYQLAKFCHRASDSWKFCVGCMSFKLPTGYCAADLISWIGREPTYTTDPITGVQTINSTSDDGVGMLGNKFMAGAANFRGGAANGGFIHTDDGFLDGTEEYDENNHLIDLGKYLSILGAVWIHQNNYTGTPYISTIATSYAGFAVTLKPESAPTNKAIRAGRMIKIVKASLLDKLAGKRIISLASKPKGIVITDAPTAARPDSDYQRLTTVRIVKKIVDKIRDRSDPFIGEPGGGPQRAALQTEIEEAINEEVPNAVLRYDISLSATPADFVAGRVNVDLILIPNFELRRIPVTIALGAE